VLRVGGLQNAQGLISIGWNKDASDPRWADDPEVMEYLTFLSRYVPSVNPDDGFAQILTIGRNFSFECCSSVGTISAAKT
jgi:hypothetical protein